jgi:uncharacterized membrane protein
MKFRDLATAAGAILVLDIPWLLIQNMIIRDPFYTGPQGTFRFIPAIIVYLALGYLLLLAESASSAALIGAATYAVYDFTLLAIRKDFSWSQAIADTIWGGILFYLAYQVLEEMKKKKYLKGA